MLFTLLLTVQASRAVVIHGHVIGVVEDGSLRIRSFYEFETSGSIQSDMVPVVLAGITLPPPGHRMRAECVRHLAGLALGKAVLIEVADVTKHGTVVGYVHTSTDNINLELVKAGLAAVNRKSLEKEYAPLFLNAENLARKRKLGIWVYPGAYRADEVGLTTWIRLILETNWQLIVLILVLSAVSSLLKVPWVRGMIGEVKARFVFALYLDRRQYRMIKNLIVPYGDETTEVDIVLISKYGIFVIEVKTFSGRIYGEPGDLYWTQVVGRKRNIFLNPVLQNRKHIQALAAYLGFDESWFHSIVFFAGNAKLVKDPPPGVLTGGLITYIEQFTEEIIPPKDFAFAVVQLEDLRDYPPVSREEHIQKVKEKRRKKNSSTSETK
ncbi:MAG: NERD domain-containing protein [Candidatus Methanomethyliaceae archaeon]